MNKNRFPIWFFLSVLLVAQSFTAASSELRILDVAVGWAKPPYIDQTNHSGYEIELVEQIMRPLGYRLNFLYVPYGRSQGMLRDGKVDLMLTAHNRLGLAPETLSNTYIIYQNVAVTLAQNQYVINRIEDLSRYSLIAFQNARLVMGQRYNDAIANSPFYAELPEQRNQVEMLFLRKTDVIVLDRNIFTYFEQELSEVREQVAYRIHTIFPENHYKVAFKDRNLKEKFNQSLALFIQTQDYAELQKKYALSSQVLHNVF